MYYQTFALENFRPNFLQHSRPWAYWHWKYFNIDRISKYPSCILEVGTEEEIDLALRKQRRLTCFRKNGLVAVKQFFFQVFWEKVKWTKLYSLLTREPPLDP